MTGGALTARLIRRRALGQLSVRSGKAMGRG